MRGVGVEEAAAIGAEFLDRLLQRHGTDGDRLAAAEDGVRGGEGREGLRHARPDQEEADDDA